MTDSAALEALARRIAEEAHAGQDDKAGEPYIGHVARVAARLDDPLDRAVAWLHDVLEDTEWTWLDIVNARAQDAAVDRAEWLDLLGDLGRLTHPHGEPRQDYYYRVRCSRRAVRVKLADIADNADPERLARLDDATRVRLEEKYRKAREALGAEVQT